ncbi:MAG TPA: phosphatase PAP2 family protein [Gaiellales bacterium]|nr:phosphatase PAP2 family protein [Gaiellales bacterium]
MRTRLLDRAVVAYTTAGNYGIGWVVAGALAGAPARVAATVWGTLGVNYAVKLAVGRERPAAADALIGLPSSSSFPSSHAAMSVAAAFALTRARPELAAIWWTAAAAMAASRVYVGAHRAGDVVAGAALGAVTGAAAGAV